MQGDARSLDSSSRGVLVLRTGHLVEWFRDYRPSCNHSDAGVKSKLFMPATEP